MKFSDFLKQVAEIKRYPDKYKVVLPAMWISEEAAEVLKPVKHALKDGLEFDKDQISEELGDLLLGVANMIDDLDLDKDEILESAVEKIKKRVKGK